ncbi:MAG: hypothetical protein F4X11_14790 [Acidobacteria bacterium]|nr:hypothetical protein [Acidobacteriota bacterium]
MTTLAPSHLEALKSFLLELRATGDDGFEGLMASVLTSITGISFRLAASGSQFGSDGTAVREEDGVSFECKRYKDKIPRSKILSKIAELSLSTASVDAWVLCATSKVSAQIACDVRKHGREFGIGTIVLDWAGVLPRLAVAVAMSTDATRQALGADASVSAAVQAVRATSDFNACAEELRLDLREPLVGTEVARQANAAWLTAALASREQAILAFGEPLSPLDEAHGTARLRADLVARVQPFMTGDAAGTILCVLGGEGAGKSWLVAHCWSRVDRRPLMVVLRPRDCQEVVGPDDCESLLASELPAQAGGPVNDGVVSGWRRKLARWRNGRRPDRPRLIVVIDGVNQRPQVDWARVIDAFGDALNRLGGRLIITVRTTYYEARLQPRLVAPVEELSVPEWTATERDEILAANGIDHTVLHRGQDAHAAVGRSLLNPRLLGIAVRLLKVKTVEHIDELSVNHLLFEHLRTREQESRNPEPAHECVRRLRTHAEAVLRRHQKGLSDDVTVFDAEDVQSVADGRYFVPVDGDPTRYALHDDGLVLAFGLVVLDRLRIALRNDRDLAAELDAAIDPIAALDQTAAALMGALTYACIDDEQPDEIVVALLRAFAELQNPNHEDLEAFKSLARTRSPAFLEAARRLCLAGWNQPNVDWIEAALVSSKAHDDVLRNIQIAVAGWLRCFSLEPSVGVRGGVSAEERAKGTEKINDDLRSLSSAERQLLEGMEETVGDIEALTRLAFTLMSGGPIAPFAKGIVQWCLAHMLNQKGWPYDVLGYVVRLNRVDWRAARAGLLKEGAIFRRTDVSRPGSWALIVLLEATGEPGDAREAEELRAKVSDFEPRRGWRLVEQYCSSDPCDPSASKPIGIAATAGRYETIDVSSLYGGPYRTGEDLFCEMARPGVVRFEAEVGVSKYREFAEEVLKRRGASLKRGLFFLRPHSALLTREMALKLAAECEKRLGATSDVPERDRWWMAQDQLLLAFPKLSAEEQVKALLGTTVGKDVLRSLLGVMKPLDETVFDRYFGGACDENNPRSQYFLLVFAKGSGTLVSRRSRDYIALLTTSQSELVRMAALERSFRLRDEKLMRQVVDSGWRAERGEERNSYENAYGSAILAEGVVRDWISVDEALDKMSSRHYGWAARWLGSTAAQEVARRIDFSIGAALGVQVENTLPDVEYRCRQEGQPNSFPYWVTEREGQSDVVAEAMKRPRSDEAFEEQERRRHEAFETFRKKVDQANAGILLDDIAKEEFEAIVDAAPDVADRWYRLFSGLSECGRQPVHNLVLMLAYALRERCPKRAVALLRAVYGQVGPIRFTVGRARVPLAAAIAWSAAGSDAGREWCHERLNLARNDHELAVEVLAALSSREEAALSEFIRERLDREEPEGIARALLVAGFSNQEDRNKDVLYRYREAKGFIGEAYRAAKHALDRDGWARYWFEEMCKADRPTEFWRYSILFTKIVDGRFATWHSEYTRQEEPMRLFWPSLDGEVNRRIEKWRKHREKTLFGGKRPADVFLPVGKRPR